MWNTRFVSTLVIITLSGVSANTRPGILQAEDQVDPTPIPKRSEDSQRVVETRQESVADEVKSTPVRGATKIAVSQYSFGIYPFRLTPGSSKVGIETWKQSIPQTNNLVRHSPFSSVELSSGMIAFEASRGRSSTGETPSRDAFRAMSVALRDASQKIVNLSLDHTAYRVGTDDSDFIREQIAPWIEFAAETGIVSVSLPIELLNGVGQDDTVRASAVEELVQLSQMVRERTQGRVRLLVENRIILSFRQMEAFGATIAQARSKQGNVKTADRIGTVISVRLLRYRMSEAVSDFIRVGEKDANPSGHSAIVGIRATCRGFGADDESVAKSEKKEYQHLFADVLNDSEGKRGRISPTFISVECLGLASSQHFSDANKMERSRPGLNAALHFFSKELPHIGNVVSAR